MNAIRNQLRRAIDWLCPPMPEEIARQEDRLAMDRLRQPMLPGVTDLYWYRV